MRNLLFLFLFTPLPVLALQPGEPVATELVLEAMQKLVESHHGVGYSDLPDPDLPPTSNPYPKWAAGELVKNAHGIGRALKILGEAPGAGALAPSLIEIGAELESVSPDGSGSDRYWLIRVREVRLKLEGAAARISALRHEGAATAGAVPLKAVLEALATVAEASDPPADPPAGTWYLYASNPAETGHGVGRALLFVAIGLRGAARFETARLGRSLMGHHAGGGGSMDYWKSRVLEWARLLDESALTLRQLASREW